ncbi:hypothetical protein P9112_011091 [Eukaryota sp. TZLM1-RC]
MHPFVDPTVITVAPKSSSSLVAPILRNADRTSCARFAEELSDFAIRMFLSRPASSTNAQLSGHCSRSSRRSARRKKPVKIAQPVEGDHEEEQSPEEIQYNLYDSIDEADEPESLDLFSEDDENPENLYEPVDAHNSVADAEALMLQYIPRCIAPEIHDTVLIIHHISSRKPKKILDYILSCTRIEDTAQAYKLYLSINFDSYSEDTSNSSSPNIFFSDFNCYDLDDVFENLDSVLPGRDFPSFPDLTQAEDTLFSSSLSHKRSPEIFVGSHDAGRKETLLRLIFIRYVTRTKTLRDNIHDFSLERTSSHLDSDMALLDADRAKRPGPSDKNSSLEESSESSATESVNTLVAAKVSAPAPAYLFHAERTESTDGQTPVTSQDLYPDHFLYGMVDTGATVSCISEGLADVAKLHVENKTTSLSLADGKLIDVKLAKGRFAFMLGGTAKLTYITLRLCLLPCPNNFILGCDALKRLSPLTEDFLFINHSIRNLQIQEDESIPDCFLPDCQNVCSHDDLTDITTVPEFVQALDDNLLKKLPDIEKTSFNLNDTALTVLNYPLLKELTVVSKKARFLPPDKLKIANEEIDTLLKNGFAVPYDGLFASPIHLVCAPVRHQD